MRPAEKEAERRGIQQNMRISAVIGSVSCLKDRYRMDICIGCLFLEIREIEMAETGLSFCVTVRLLHHRHNLLQSCSKCHIYPV